MSTVEGVTKAYGDFTAVDDVSLAAQRGPLTGFPGPRGAGKSTTTLRVVVGSWPSTTGSHARPMVDVASGKLFWRRSCGGPGEGSAANP